MRSIPLSILSILLLLGCSNPQELASSDNSSPEAAEIKVSPQKPCASSPPIINLLALKPVLIEQGLLASDASDEEAKKAARIYIKKKQQQLQESCKKQGK